jgi:hypothetical protein
MNYANRQENKMNYPQTTIISTIADQREEEEREESRLGYELIDFEGYDNSGDVPPFDTFIVPNYIHLIYLKINEIKFYQMVNIYSMFLNQKPTRIYIHCDVCDFHGRYWEQLYSIEEIKKILIFNKIRQHYTIFGVPVRWIEHR